MSKKKHHTSDTVPHAERRAQERRSQHAEMLDALDASPPLRDIVRHVAAIHTITHPIAARSDEGHAPGFTSSPPPGFTLDREAATVLWDEIDGQLTKWAGWMRDRVAAPPRIRPSDRRKTRCEDCGGVHRHKRPWQACCRNCHGTQAQRWWTHCPRCGAGYHEEAS